MYEKKDWKDSEFDKIVRIKSEDLEFLKKVKKFKSIAGMLHFIISKYRKDVLQNMPKKQFHLSDKKRDKRKDENEVGIGDL